MVWLIFKDINKQTEFIKANYLYVILILYKYIDWVQ